MSTPHPPSPAPGAWPPARPPAVRPQHPAAPPWASKALPEASRSDLAALLAARQELGEEYETALVESFAERVEQVVEARTAARERALADERRADKGALSLAITSLALGIPISGIAAGTAELPGLVVAWIGIVLVNLAYALSHRRPPR